LDYSEQVEIFNNTGQQQCIQIGYVFETNDK